MPAAETGVGNAFGRADQRRATGNVSDPSGFPDAFVAALSPGERNTFKAWVSQLGEPEVVAALAHVTRVDDGAWREEARLALIERLRDLMSARLPASIETWAADNVLAATRWVDATSDAALQATVYSALAGSALRLSGAEAAEAFRRLPAGPLRDRLLATAVERWGAENARAAVTWAQQLERREDRANALVRLAGKWAAESPRQAAEQAARISPAVLAAVMSHWSRQEPAAAAEWLRANLSPSERRGALAVAIAQWAERDPFAAARFTAALPPGRDQDEAVLSAVSGWARHDPRAAAEWVGKFPSSDIRQSAIDQVLAAWAQQDAAAAGEWLLAWPESHERDHALSTLSGFVFSKNPTAAMALARVIEDERLRLDRIDNLERRARLKDPSATR